MSNSSSKYEAKCNVQATLIHVNTIASATQVSLDAINHFLAAHNYHTEGGYAQSISGAVSKDRKNRACIAPAVSSTGLTTTCISHPVDESYLYGGRRGPEGLATGPLIAETPSCHIISVKCVVHEVLPDLFSRNVRTRSKFMSKEV